MTLSISRYIKNSNIEDSSIRYKWDDWNVEQAEYPINKRFCAALEKLSERAILAFMCGTAEWIYYHFEVLSGTTSPLDYLEAAWMRLVDPLYGGERWEEYSADWSGPVKGPIKRAMDRVEQTIEQLFYEEVDPYEDAALIANLAKYVMDDSGYYEEWCDQAMKKLAKFYPRDFSNQLGDVVPREILDPDFNFEEDLTVDLISNFMSALDYKNNVFLNSPKHMIEQGFKGIPYKFNMEKKL